MSLKKIRKLLLRLDEINELENESEVNEQYQDVRDQYIRLIQQELKDIRRDYLELLEIETLAAKTRFMERITDVTSKSELQKILSEDRLRAEFEEINVKLNNLFNRRVSELLEEMALFEEKAFGLSRSDDIRKINEDTLISNLSLNLDKEGGVGTGLFAGAVVGAVIMPLVGTFFGGIVGGFAGRWLSSENLKLEQGKKEADQAFNNAIKHFSKELTNATMASTEDLSQRLSERTFQVFNIVDGQEISSSKTNSEGNKPEQVEFSCFYPRTVYLKNRYSLLVYAHLPELEELVLNDVERFKTDFGEFEPKRRSGKNSVVVNQNTPITVELESDKLNFDPELLTRKWNSEWIRFNFEFLIPENKVDETAFVKAFIRIHGIEVASIQFAIDIESPRKHSKLSVSSAAVMGFSVNKAEASGNPLMTAKLSQKTIPKYHKIFVSYSREDTKIARAYKFAQLALGNKVFIDVDDLRAGEDWKAGLASAIDQSDKLQLFWSESSSNSIYCKYEWQYALQHKCPESGCVEFITPVYWTEPLPDIPSELQHLNFKYVPFEVEADEVE